MTRPPFATGRFPLPSTDRTRLPFRSAVRLLPLALALVLGLSPADAAPVDPAQVGTMAAAWMDRSVGFQGARIHSVRPLTWDAAQPAFYLVRLDPGGWILAGGDDALRPVVGWSTQGPVDGGLPPALASHLQDVERAVLDLRAAGGDGDGDGGRNQAAWSDLLHGHGPGSTGLRTSPGDVQPMLAAAWGQGSLYNTDCPGDPAGPGGHAFVGCVGVAIAQVLEYWNWPRQGQSVQSYTHETYGVIRVDFHQETYDWDAIMPDEINADVKELLYHAGVSVRMNYGPGSSTAQSSMIATGLRSFFRYQDTTLESMSAYYNIPKESLKNSIDSFNQAVVNGKDLEYGKPILDNAPQIITPPYFAMRLWPKVHFTMGGVGINTRAEVIDREGNPIPKLFAAGEVTGGVHGASRLGSCSITDCLVFGRIAGRNAAGAGA